MALLIPKREKLMRISIGDAFAYLVAKTVKPGSNIDLGAAIHFAAVRVSQRMTMSAVMASSVLSPLEFLDTDPIEIASAIWDGIVSKKLSVEGLPHPLMDQWITRPVVTDWSSGLVVANKAGVNGQYFPTLDQREIDELFAIERKADKQSGSLAEAEDVTKIDLDTPAGTVATAMLVAFLRPLMASERLTEAEARARTAKHFAPKTFPDQRWREVFRDEPNKLKRGEKPPRKYEG